MLSVVLLTPSAATAEAIQNMLEDSSIFKLVGRGSPFHCQESVRICGVHDPELVLIDLSDWNATVAVVRHLRKTKGRKVLIGFRPMWNRLELLTFEEAGIVDLLHEPFSHHDLETVAYDALHRGQAADDQNVVAFLPAKAGSGCSTVALHVAAALADSHAKKVLLIESDRRSGVLSIMLNLKNRSGLSEALQQAGDMTTVDWQQHSVWVAGIHLLPANPARRGPPPTWAEYYQLLRFARKPYDYVFADLPEVVNEATAEVVKSARAICIVCTPEVPPLKMAAQRVAELEACQIPSERIHVVLNRWERGGLSIDDVEGILERPVLATLPNDYKQVKTAILESRVVSPDSRFARSAKTLAQKLSGLPDAQAAESKFTFLRELVRIGD